MTARRLALTGLLSIVCMWGVVHAVETPGAKADIELTESELKTLAKDAVSDFFDALEKGDVEQLREALGGSFAHSREPVLSSESYGEELRRLHRGSEYRVADVLIHSSGTATVTGYLKNSSGQATAITLLLTLEYSQTGVRYLVSGERTTSRL